MKNLAKILFLGVFILSFNALSSQTTFSLDAASIDSAGNLTVIGCPQDDHHYWKITSKLSGYTRSDSILIVVNWGGGIVDSVYNPVYLNVGSSINQFYPYGRIQNIPIGNYRPQFIGVTPDGKRDTVFSQNRYIVKSCGNISGNVFLDVTVNCKRDPREKPYYTAIVELENRISKSKFYTHSDTSGNYSMHVPAGNYDITVSTPFSKTCPKGGHLNVSSNSTGIDFGLEVSSVKDVLPSVFGRSFRPMTPRGFGVSARNLSSSSASGEIKIILSDPRIAHAATYPLWTQPIRVVGDTVVFSYSNISYANSLIYNSIPLYVQANLNAKIGDTICFDVEVTPIIGDADTTNNRKTYCFPVSNSYDPNDKQGLPFGIGPDNIIDRGQDIEYKIRFQNTGNDTAYKVVLVDTLQEEMDISSIQILGSSHEFDMSLDDNSVLKFTFNDINLVDSATNEPESNGFVSFKISQKPNLAYGTNINNTAYIYFDYNEAIITNTTHHRVDKIGGNEVEEPDGIDALSQGTVRSFKLFPNPAHGNVTIERANDELGIIRVYDISGKLALTMNTDQTKTQMSTKELNPGIYFVEVLDSGREIQKLIVQ